MPAPADSSTFQYVLKVAYLHTLIKQRSRHADLSLETSPPPPSLLPSSSYTRRSHEGHGASTSSIFAFEFGSLLGRDSSKSPKYPEKMLKVLDGMLQKIAMGHAPKYADQRFRRSIALFWSSTWPDKHFQRQTRDTRKIEDIILAFVTSSTKSLKKEEGLADGMWKYELGIQVSLFIDVLSDAMAVAGATSGELHSRLASYRSRLKIKEAPPKIEPEQQLLEGQDGSLGQKSSSTVTDGIGDGIEVEGGLVEAVGKLYNVLGDELRERILEIKADCSEQAALDDLKACLKLLNTDTPYPYTREAFNEHTQWLTWRSNEVSELSQMMLVMMQWNPSLSQSPHHKSISDLSAQLENVSLDQPFLFTFIPPDARASYCDLLDRCLEWDLEILKTLPEDEDVSLGILSQQHLQLLRECSVRWRLPATFQAWVFLQAIVSRFERGDVPAACVNEAIMMARKIQSGHSLSTWAISDRNGLESTYLRHLSSLLATLEAALELPQGYHSCEFLEAAESIIFLDINAQHHSLVQRACERLIDKVKSCAFNTYINQASEVLTCDPAKTHIFLLKMASWLEKETKRLNQKYKVPVAGELDLVPLVLQQHLTLWFRDLEDVMHSLLPNKYLESMDDLFGLYKRSRKLVEMGSVFLSSKTAEDHYLQVIASCFDQLMQVWLDQSELKTKQWADQALAVDKFVPSVPHGPSSSVTDLFDSFKSVVQFLMSLDFPNEEQLSHYATRLSKIISVSISDYCCQLERLFAVSMQQAETSQTVAKQKAWLEKAKSTLASLQGERKIAVFFNFTPESCVKLNNIEAARQQLDDLYRMMRVDDMAEYNNLNSREGQLQRTSIFTVKIVLAEGLALDANHKLPDAFVILSDEHGARYAKTRTVYDDADPRWDESFDISVKERAWFMVTVKHRNLSGKHDLLGRAYLQLDPAHYADLNTQDFFLRLDPCGHILLRISMEGERDDIQFHFGRAFRWLKRTESDMIRVFVDKMTPLLRHTLSRNSIKLVMKPFAGSLDYNEALGKMAAVYRSAIGSPEYGIPPTRDDRNRGPTDHEIETAIHPLFDYLDTNNHTLASTLSPDAMQMVMTKLWKQILMTIEGLIVPPLSDKPSRMRALSDGELDVALKWMKFLRDFFYVGGDASGVPLSILQNQKFNEILSVRIYYDWKTDDLMEECIRGFQSTLRHRATKPTKSLRAQRNLGTIRARKTAKKALPTSGSNTEMIMRILRMRQGTQEFLAQQLQTISVVKLEDPIAQKRQKQSSGARPMP